MEVMRNGRNHFGSEERRQPDVWERAHDIAFERQPGLVARIFCKRQDADIARQKRRQPKRVNGL